MTTVQAYAVFQQGGPLQPFSFELAEIGCDEVDVDILYCGICHSDLSMLDNDWHMTQYPFVPGHEIVGRVAAVGSHVPELAVGQTVGVGWYSRSCLHCPQCLGGDQNLCLTAEGVMLGRHGGYATRVRAQWPWVTPLPAVLDPAAAGPMFCGGITVFNPIVQNNVRPIDRVGVVGIGGLGHLALQFLHAWGCEVTAFSTTPDKEAEARGLGADHFVPTRDAERLQALANSFDLILDTVNVALDWDLYIAMLKPRGRLHIVGAAPQVTASIFPMLGGQKSISGSPLGSPVTIARMLDFAARHKVAPLTETYPLSRVNEALDRLRSGQARYRVVLQNDLS
jgi:uncharacterized zinc-type alcohol dehydrogenase-like protein